MTAASIILVADPNEDVMISLSKALAETNLTVLHAKDGKEALSIVNSQGPYIAAAIVELELPLVNGLDLIGRLTSQQPKPRKIIATTFLAYEPLLELARHLGADDILRKPVPQETWLEAVRPLLPDYARNGHASA